MNEALSLLKQLVDSLSKSERRYLVLFTAQLPENTIVLYLLALLQKNTYEEALSIFRTKYADTQLEVARKQLYNILMKCLRNYKEHASEEIELLNALQNAAILVEKGLIAKALATLFGAKKTAEMHEMYSMLAVINQKITDIQVLYVPSDLTEEALIAQTTETVRCLEMEINLTKNQQLSRVLQTRFMRNGFASNSTEKAALNDLLIEEFQLINQQKQQAFRKERDHLLFQAAYFRITNNSKAATSIYRELLLLFRNQKNVVHASEFLVVVNNILFELYAMRQWEQMEGILETYQTLRLKPVQYQTQFQATLTKYHLLIHCHQGAGSAIQKLLLEYERFALIAPKHLAYEFQYLQALAYFYILKYSETINLSNKALKRGKNVTDLFFIKLFRMLFILAHIKLGNIDYLHYEVRSYRKALPPKSKLLLIEKSFLEFVLAYISGSNQKMQVQRFMNHVEKLRQIPEENRIICMLPLDALNLSPTF